MRIDDLMASLPASYTSAEREVVQRAYRVAEAAHQGQTRASGEPYINHCLAVASILTELRVPHEVIAAGLVKESVRSKDKKE